MKPWYILSLSLTLASPSYAGNGFAQWGVQLSVTPGQPFPIGLGLEGGVGYLGTGDNTAREEAFLTLEMRGFSYLRAVVGARIGLGATYTNIVDHIGGMPEFGVGVALRSLREAPVGLHLDAGVRHRVAGDNGTLLLRADYTVAGTTDLMPPLAFTVGFGVNKGSYDWVRRKGPDQDCPRCD